MEPSNNYQTTVDTDTFHPREPDPEDVARVRARANESNLPERNSRALTRPTDDIPTPARSDRWPPGAKVSPRRTQTPARTSLNSTLTAEGPSQWTPWAPSSVRLRPHLYSYQPRPHPRRPRVSVGTFSLFPRASLLHPSDDPYRSRAVNEDGTLSRIMNWSKMTDREREVTQRRIAKRNKDRLDRLRAAETGTETGTEEETKR